MTRDQYNKSVDTYADNIYRFILKSIKDTGKAEDIVQDTYEKLWNNLSSVSSEKVKGFLFKTAYRTMIDYLRKDKHNTELDVITEEDIAHTNQYSDLQEILHKAIDQLPEQQRSVLLLRDYEGYSYKEISEITKLNESQVKVYIYRARVFMRNIIYIIINNR